MANQSTWDGMNEVQQELLRRIFGELKIDGSIPDGQIEISDGEQATTVPVAKLFETIEPLIEPHMSKEERLALAKQLREKLAERETR